jgi:hypothetical protein
VGAWIRELAKGRHTDVCRDDHASENMYFKTKTKGLEDI